MGSYVCKDCGIGKPPEEFKKVWKGLKSRTCKKCFGKKVWATRRANQQKREQAEAEESEPEAPVEVDESPEDDEPAFIDMAVDLCERISEVFSDMANLLRR